MLPINIFVILVCEAFLEPAITFLGHCIRWPTYIRSYGHLYIFILPYTQLVSVRRFAEHAVHY